MKVNRDFFYLTGLSIDKKRFNNITENINFDKDYCHFTSKNLKKIRKSFEDTFEKIFITLRSTGVTDKLKKKTTSTIISDIGDIPYIGKKIESGLEKIFDISLQKISSYEEIASQFPKQIKKITNHLNNSIPFYKPGDFFSLYLAHQSDSCGVGPLSKILAEKNFNLTHIYCDRPYYENQYIDHVILKISKSLFCTPSPITGKFNLDLEKITKDFENLFNLHINDIILSKILSDLNTLDTQKNSINKKHKPLIEFNLTKNISKISTNDLLKSLAERNFFGIGLLSLILSAINDKWQETEKEPIFYEINHSKNSSEYHFLNELFELSSDPNNERFEKFSNSRTNKPPLIESKVYFSDGINLTNNLTDLLDDDFVKNFYDLPDHIYKYKDKDIKSLDEDELSEYQTIKFFFKEIIQRTTIIEPFSSEYDYIKKSIFHLKNMASLDHYLKLNYAQENNNFIFLKIPIKIVLSLPINKSGKADHNISLPALLDSNNESINLLTVGGAEHNRGLAHLINKHRIYYKDNRLFGFMDNYFDFMHKLSIAVDSDKTSLRKKHNFFLGINQPVSGWNYIFNCRHDDEIGNSINNDIKLLGFRLKDDPKINILSIYGFSASASVLGLQLLIAEFLERNLTKGCFENRYSNYMDKYYHKYDEGSTATINFIRTIEDIIELKKYTCCLYKELEQSRFSSLLQEDTKKIIQIQNIIKDLYSIDSYLYLFNSNLELFKKLFSFNREDEDLLLPIIIRQVINGSQHD